MRLIINASASGIAARLPMTRRLALRASPLGLESKMAAVKRRVVNRNFSAARRRLRFWGLSCGRQAWQARNGGRI